MGDYLFAEIKAPRHDGDAKFNERVGLFNGARDQYRTHSDQAVRAGLSDLHVELLIEALCIARLSL